MITTHCTLILIFYLYKKLKACIMYECIIRTVIIQDNSKTKKKFINKWLDLRMFQPVVYHDLP